MMKNSKLGTRNAELILPALPDGSAEATVEHLYVAAGEHVQRGQALALVRTERYAYDIPAAASGVLQELSAAPGEQVTVGQPLARLAGDEHATPPEPAADQASVVESAPQAAPAPASASRNTGQAPPLRATPLARKIASAKAIDLALVAPRSHRLLRRDDVLRFGEAAAAPNSQSLGIAQRRAAASVPTSISAMEIDWTSVDDYIARHAQRRARHAEHPDRRACLASAAAGALTRHRLVHAAWDEAGIRVRGEVDLLVGEQVVRRAADLSPSGIARALAQPDADDTAERPFTIAEGAAGLWSEATLPDGAAALLCVGHAESRVRVVGHEERIAARPVSLLVLVYDARVLDQRLADAFLADVCSRLERIGSLC